MPHAFNAPALNTHSIVDSVHFGASGAIQRERQRLKGEAIKVLGYNDLGQDELLAFRMAKHWHAGQERASGGSFLEKHIAVVYGNVRQILAKSRLPSNVQRDIRIAALLHDAPEDFEDGTKIAAVYERIGNVFGRRVLDYVRFCTQEGDTWQAKRDGYLALIRRLELKDEAKFVLAIADKKSNAADTYAEIDDHLLGKHALTPALLKKFFEVCKGVDKGYRRLWYLNNVTIEIAKRAEEVNKNGRLNYLKPFVNELSSKVFQATDEINLYRAGLEGQNPYDGDRTIPVLDNKRSWPVHYKVNEAELQPA